MLRHFVETEQSPRALIGSLRGRFPFDWHGNHRPNLVLFGDALAQPDWDDACRAADTCDLLLSIGTSGSVYPAALLPGRAADAGAAVIHIDPHECPGCWLEGKASEILPQLLRDAFESPTR